MRVLIFHPTLLPPKDYGGIERVVLWLAQGLLEKGHEVYVAALAGSRLPPGCHLIEVEKKPYSAIKLAALFPQGLDVVHFMAPLPEVIWDQLPVPALLTVHGNGQLGEKYPKNSVFLSRNHALRHGASFFIYNGIDPAEYIYQPELKEDWCLFLSKTNWSVKNLRGAMQYCKRSRTFLKVAGGSRPWMRRLECSMSRSMDWIGPVSGITKANLLGKAKALIFPVVWPEPFGLVVAEALMSGTPVIASPRGSLPEMVPSDVGCLPTSDEEWVEVLSRRFNSQINSQVNSSISERCRQWALEKFHFLRMAQDYEVAYRKIGSGSLLNQKNPIAGNWRNE